MTITESNLASCSKSVSQRLLEEVNRDIFGTQDQGRIVIVIKLLGHSIIGCRRGYTYKSSLKDNTGYVTYSRMKSSGQINIRKLNPSYPSFTKGRSSPL